MNLSSNNCQRAQRQQMKTAQGKQLSNPPRQETDAIAQLQDDFKLLQLQRDLKQLHPKISHTLREIEALRANHPPMCSSTTDVIPQIQYDLKQLYAAISHMLRKVEALQANHYTLCSLTTKHYIKQLRLQQQVWIRQLNQSVSIFVSQLRSHSSGVQTPKLGFLTTPTGNGMKPSLYNPVPDQANLQTVFSRKAPGAR